MPPARRNRRTSPEEGRAAVARWLAGEVLDRGALATAVRWSLEELADRAPGHSVEVRVPPFAAVQCLEGPRHTRGTPPNVVETDAQTWLGLACGRHTWEQAFAEGQVSASGERAHHVGDYLPLT